MTAIRTARARARAEIRAEILAIANTHLAQHGPAGLSLRAVARDLNIVPSAVYRYFDNRDSLLTALIVQSYDSLGDATDAAIAAVPNSDPLRQWLAGAHAVRAWAFAHPHEYALLFGSPVPGYQAPDDTIGPGTRVPFALASIAARAHELGLLHPDQAVLSEQTRADLDVLGSIVEHPVSTNAIFWMTVAWTQLFGLVTFELFGQTKGMVSNGEQFFADAVLNLAARLGLSGP